MSIIQNVEILETVPIEGGDLFLTRRVKANESRKGKKPKSRLKVIGEGTENERLVYMYATKTTRRRGR